MAWIEAEGAEGGTLLFIVLEHLASDGLGGVVRFPAPLADRDKLKRHPFVPAQAGSFTPDEKPVADPDVGGHDQPGGAVGGKDALDDTGGRSVKILGGDRRSGRGGGLGFFRRPLSS